MKLSYWKFIKDHCSKVPPLAKADISGKTIIVTGASIGLGLEAAKHFARMTPGKLIVTCRNKEKAEATWRRELARDCITTIQLPIELGEKQTGCENVEAWVLDLEDFSSVKAFVERFEKEGGDRLDILLENAGVALPKLGFTKDGWETSAQVNNLSSSLLAILLLPKMFYTAEVYNTVPRLVVVSSDVHYWINLSKQEVNSMNFFRSWGHSQNLKKIKLSRYGETKLLNIFFVRALNDRLHRKPLIVNTINPGMCVSSLNRHLKFPVSAITWLSERVLARTTEEGGRSLVFAAIGAEETRDELRGAYISLAEVREPADCVLGDGGGRMQDKLWRDLIEELTLIEPKVLQIVREYLMEPVRDKAAF